MRSYTPDDLVLIGGRYSVTNVDTAVFLAGWALENIPYVVVDVLGDGVRIGKISWWNDFDAILPRVMRLHIFGPGGDLTWRRDENRAFWRYVGGTYPELPEAITIHDFWDESKVSELLVDEDNPRHALLWGQYDDQKDHWHEDRVGKASAEDRLRYPDVDAQPGERVEVLAWELRQPDDSAVVAYWTYGFRILPTANDEQEQA